MRFDFADIKPSLLNWFVIGLMAVTFITFWKYILAQYNVPGFSDLLASV